MFGTHRLCVVLYHVIFGGLYLSVPIGKIEMEGQASRHALTHQTMTPNATDNQDGRTESDEERRRYAELNIGDEEFVIYDRENHQAWIQSTVAVPVEESC